MLIFHEFYMLFILLFEVVHLFLVGFPALLCFLLLPLMFDLHKEIKFRSFQSQLQNDQVNRTTSFYLRSSSCSYIEYIAYEGPIFFPFPINMEGGALLDEVNPRRFDETPF